MATLTSKLIVALVDRVTGPTRAITRTIDRLNDAQERNNRKLNAVRGRMLEAGAVAYGLARAVSAPVRAATEFETKLEDIGQKIDEPVAKLPKLGREIRAVARATTQSASAIAEGMDVLAGMGASRSDALSLLNPIGRAATAYNASIADLSQAGYAALDNLKVPAQEFGKALDAMAQAGKAGAFELRDMAQYFPALGAGYQALGQTGVPAVADLSAALQIVRKGAGDSAEAATNLSNILQKVYAPKTIKAFKKMGVDLRSEMEKAAKAGMTPIEAITEITNRTLKGDLSRIGDLFADAQVQKGLRPLIQNIDLYRQIRAEALAAQGVVEEDYKRRLQTGAAATMRWRNAIEGLNLAIGGALLPALTSLANDIIPIVNKISEWTDKHPALTRAIVTTAAALVSLRVAALLAQFSFLWMKGGLISGAILGLRGLRGALLGVGGAFRIAGRAARGARGAIAGASMLGAVGGGGLLSGMVAGVGTAVTAIMGALSGLVAGIAAITAPVWGVVAAILAAVLGLALAIYNYWVPISNFVSGFVSVIYDALSSLVSTIAGFGARIAAAVGGWVIDRVVDIAGLLGIDEATVRAVIDGALATISGFASSAVAFIKSIPAKVGGWIADIFTMNTYSDAATAGFRSAGERAGHALVDAVESAINALIDWFKSLPRRIIAAIGKIDLSSIISWPSPPSWWTNRPSWLGGSGGNSAAIEGARAAGGPVRAGGSYLVGERGPEIVTFARDGFVHDALKTARIAALAASATALPLPAIAAPAIPSVGRATASVQQGREGPSINVASGAFPITIQAAPGQSPQEIAESVERVLSEKLTGLYNGAFNDGVN